MTLPAFRYYGFKVSLKTQDLNTNYHQTEQEILAELEWIYEAQQDPEVFQKLYDKYFDAIFNYVFRRIAEEEITADLVSQTFFKALQNIKKYEYKGMPFSAWLYKIAGNEISRYYKKSKTNPVFSLEEPLLVNIIEESVDEDFQLEYDETIKILMSELQKLSTEDLAILELRFFEDKGFKEIAYILEIGESKAKMRTYRALEKLKKGITTIRRSGYDKA